MKISLPAIILVILGILLLVGPWTFAPVCEINGMFAKLANGKDLVMPCGWTARAEIGVGALTILAGLLLAFFKSAETKRVIGFFGIGLGVLAFLGVVIIAVACWVIYDAQKEMAL